MIEAQKETRKLSSTSTAHGPENIEKSNKNDDDDDVTYTSPQTFVQQLFKLYDEGLIDDANIRDQVFLMV